MLNLLERAGAARSIVFVNTKIAAERVAERLQKQGILAGTLSGDVPQKKREKLLARFQRGEMEALVATDVAARGLHIEGVSHVFNYDLPQDAEDYVHRIGRTARLGAEGDAVSFACDLYAMSLPDIETYIGQKIPAATVTPDLLLSPKPRRSAAQAAAHAAIDDADESDAGAPHAAETHARPSRRKRGSHERGTSSAARIPAARVPSGATPQPAAQVAAAPADAVPGAAVPAARKRRRRGGHGRRHEVEAHKAAAQAAASTHVPAARRPEPRPPRGAHAAEHAAQHAPKPGFLRRIAALFRRR